MSALTSTIPPDHPLFVPDEGYTDINNNLVVPPETTSAKVDETRPLPEPEPKDRPALDLKSMAIFAVLAYFIWETIT